LKSSLRREPNWPGDLLRARFAATPPRRRRQWCWSASMAVKRCQASPSSPSPVGTIDCFGHEEKDSQRAYRVSIVSISGIPTCSREGPSRAIRRQSDFQSRQPLLNKRDALGRTIINHRRPNITWPQQLQNVAFRKSLYGFIEDLPKRSRSMDPKPTKRTGLPRYRLDDRLLIHYPFVPTAV
jgi:hypothetical protein